MRVHLRRILQIGIFFLVAVVVSYSLLWVFEKPFDEQLWKSSEAIRYKMVDDLIESQKLKGKTKAEVISILGNPNSSTFSDKDFFIYKIGDPPSFFNSNKEHLLIIFKNQSVDEVTLAVE